MGRKLYVGNLPSSATEDLLLSRFSEHGKVESIKLITDRDTGESKGFGFVEMTSAGEANAAIAALDGVRLDGVPLRVNEAKPLVKRSGGGRSGFGGRGR
jgi:RNA recognition motif-containing protein